MADGPSGHLVLECAGGPQIPRIEVPGRGVFVLGRQSGCDAVLGDGAVSRRHAQIAFRGGTWLLTDLDSRHGTWVNQSKLSAGVATPIFGGDVVRIGPWSLRVLGPSGGGGTGPHTRVMTTHDDAASTVFRVNRVPASELALRAQHRLDLLMESAATIAGAGTEDELAEALLDALVSATGFAHAAFLKTMPSEPAGGPRGRVEVVALRGGGGAGDDGAPVFSRSLLDAASGGEVVRLEAGAAPNVGQTMMDLGIDAAMCAPVMVDGTAAAYVYLDARRSGASVGRSVQADAPAFCQALARIGGLALANLQRVELARRQKRLESDLEAAREVQRRIMPPASGRIGPVGYALRSTPGRYVAGDLVDVFELPGGRVGVMIGDVSGKGIDAAIVMATAQAYVHASLAHSPSPAAAVGAVNRHLAPRMADGRFVSLWVGVIDADGASMTYVDAGHGYWSLVRGGEPVVRGVSEGAVHGLLLGVDLGAEYAEARVALGRGSRVVVYSDGLPEQMSPAGEQFGVSGVLGVLGGPGRERGGSAQVDVDTLGEALRSHAGGGALTDDVTIVSVEIV